MIIFDSNNNQVNLKAVSDSRITKSDIKILIQHDLCLMFLSLPFSEDPFHLRNTFTEVSDFTIKFWF